MAIAPTGAIYKSLIFDGEDSRDYGVYITGQAVFNAPEREVEMITIPGRNGSFSLDNGRFQNIEVTYPAGIFADSDADFAQAISDFRNFLCSRKGYCRLTDDYNPDEYRMAIYKSGLDVKLSELKAGEFNITFNCKPQRFLTSGETAVTIASGNTITNPTLFESSPMLEVTGYGSVGINSETVTVNNIVLGEIQISLAKQNESSTTSVYPNVGNLNAGDSIYQKETQGVRVTLSMRALLAAFSSLSIESVTNGTCSYHGSSSRVVYINVYPTIPTYAKGTDQTTTTTVSLKIRMSDQSTFDCTYTVTTQYIGASNTIRITASRTTGWPPSTSVKYETNCSVSPFYGDSTKTLLPTPMYIDLDIGEAYGEVNNEIISFNNIVSMPTKLPVLDVGTNTITFDNTVTDLKIVPRWWKI